MRYLGFLVCFAIALGGCAGQPSPDASPTATEIAQAPSPTRTPSLKETPRHTSTATPSLIPTKTPTPQPAATRTPTPIPTVSPKEFKEQLSQVLGGEWKEVAFEGKTVGYRINNLEFVLPNFEVPVENWDAEHFLINKESQRIAPLVSLPESHIAKFSNQEKIEIYQDGQLIVTLNPDVSWALKPGRYVKEPLKFEGKELMVRIKPDQGTGEKPLVEAFDPETLKTIRSSLPAILSAHLPPGGTAHPDLEENRWWGDEEQKLARVWSLMFPAGQFYVEIATWRVGEPVEPVLARMKIENFEGLRFVGFPEDKFNYLKDVISWFKVNDPIGWEYFKQINPEWIVYLETGPVGGGPGSITFAEWDLPPQFPPGALVPNIPVTPNIEKAYLSSVLIHEATHVIKTRMGDYSEWEPCVNQIECFKRLKQVRVSDNPEEQEKYELQILAWIDGYTNLLQPGNYCNP